jgi:trehalose 6-phosphate phosphatase
MHWQAAIDDTLNALVTQPRFGLVTDVDGTISPIVNEPDAAQVTPRNRELLQALQAELALVAVISGRGVADVRNRVGIPDLVYVGNHGLEWWIDGQIETAPAAQQYRPALDTALEAAKAKYVPGMLFEDKGATLSIHYRQTRNPDAVADMLTPVFEQIANQHGLKLFRGRMVFEIRPPVQVNKGSAFKQLIERYELGAAVYLGDDTTDTDALHMARQLREEGGCEAFGLGVLAEDAPPVVREAADFFLDGVADVEAFFAWVLKARQASSN